MCDANDAGRRAGERLAELLTAECVDPILVEPPAGLDAADGTPVIDLNAWAQLDHDWATQLDDAVGVAPIDHNVETACIQRDVDD
ncbi:MAG: hypothetical protein QM733_04535 [Ilumatobacteraceae bacterium]